MEPEKKKLCTDGDVSVGGSSKTIGTHNGNFHCDDALACYMLKILPEYKDSK